MFGWYSKLDFLQSIEQMHRTVINSHFYKLFWDITISGLQSKYIWHIFCLCLSCQILLFFSSILLLTRLCYFFHLYYPFHLWYITDQLKSLWDATGRWLFKNINCLFDCILLTVISWLWDDLEMNGKILVDDCE